MGKETPAILIKYFLIRHGWKFAVLGAIWGSFVLLVSVLLYSITEPYSIVNDYVSNLGVGPNGSALVFGIGSAIMGLLYVPFLLILTSHILKLGNEKVRWIIYAAFICGSIAVIGLLILCFNSMAPATISIHATGAGIYFITTFLLVSFFTWAFHRIQKSSIWQDIVFLIVALSFLGMMIASAYISIVIIMPQYSIAFPTSLSTFQAVFQHYLPLLTAVK